MLIPDGESDLCILVIIAESLQRETHLWYRKVWILPLFYELRGENLCKLVSTRN